jgi:hypothetical protein
MTIVSGLVLVNYPHDLVCQVGDDSKTLVRLSNRKFPPSLTPNPSTVEGKIRNGSHADEVRHGGIVLFALVLLFRLLHSVQGSRASSGD